MKFIKNIAILLYRVLALTMFREQWAGDKDEKLTDIEEGYEYTEIPSTLQTEEEKQAFAKEHGLTYRKPEEKKEPEKPADPDKPKPPPDKDELQVVEVRADEKLNFARAEELLKDFEDDEEVEILGEKYTKKDFLAKVKENEAPAKPAEDKTYKIGKETLTQDEYTALLADYMKYAEVDDEYIKDRDPKILKKDLELFSKLENRSKALHKESQEAARIRTELSAEADKLEGQWERVENEKKEHEKKKTELEALIAKDPRKEFEEIDDDDERRDKVAELKTQQMLAKDKLEDVEEKIKTSDKTLDALDLRSKQLFYHSTYEEINQAIPELALDESPLKILSGKKIVDYDKAEIANIVDSLIKAYYIYWNENPKTEWKIEDFYRVNKFKFNPAGIAVKTNGKREPEKPASEKRKKRLMNLIIDQKNSPFTIRPGGGDPTAGKNKEEARVKKVLEDTGYAVDHSKFGDL